MVKATYYDGDPVTEDPTEYLNQSSIVGNGNYDVKIEYSNTGNDNWTASPDGAGLSWVNAQITASYNSTKQFNVLTVNSKSALIDKPERTAWIRVSLNNTKPTVSKVTTTIATLDVQDKLEKVTAFKNTEITKVKTAYSAANNVLTVNNSIISNAKKVVTTSVAVQEPISDILKAKVAEFDTNVSELESMQEQINRKEIRLTDKTSYTAYFTYLEKAVKLSYEITNKFNRFVNTGNTIVDEINSITSTDRALIFKYTESMAYANPVINVSTSISYNGYNGISYTITRNANSLLNKPEEWGVTIKYNFINKNGDLVDAEGNTPAKDYNIPIIKPGNSITYKGIYNHADISLAASGYRTETETQVNYYNVVTISYSKVDRGSLWGIGQGNKDSGIAYWGSYLSTGGTLSKISDDIYLTFKLTGQDAKINSKQKYSFWSMNIKNQANGYEQAFEQANEIEFVGLSKVKYTKSASASTYNSIKIGNNVYILKNAARTSIGSPECKTTAASERTILNNVAQEYYNNNKNSLVLSKNTIPVKVANNITGIKIKDVTITPENAFAGTMSDPIISSTGSWRNNSGSNASNSNNTQYTFGNARISSIYIDAWDDISMTIKFTITGGNATNIPNGTTIVETKTSNNGSTKFTFLQNSKSYISTQFYNYYRFSATAWNNNSCVVTYELYNQYGVAKTNILTDKVTLYNRSTNKLQTYYSDQEIKYAMTNTDRNATYQATPLLNFITGIKFWIGINTSGIVVNKKFESSTSSIGVQVTLSGRYDNPTMKNVSIVNALYNSSTTVSNTTSSSSSYNGRTLTSNNYSTTYYK